ncbi:MAG: methyltransferase domain-containing protein [Lachnospiraceae bacterium]|nr:methyltransferase domain-containing protein [Lachnospiraceae bacterium]
MKDMEDYASQWDISAKYFYDKEYYSWMAKGIEEYYTILEVGCGTGYSTLALVQAGHKVIAIEKNPDCITKAKKLLRKKEISDNNVIFIEGDVADDSFRKTLIKENEFDVVICWNTGTYWNKEMMQYYLPHMLEYGLNMWQIKDNPESSYAELILWESCRLASEKKVAIHIVDRGAEILTEKNDPYYKVLQSEFHYSEILYDNQLAKSISSGGRTLSTNGVVDDENIIDIVLISILMK